MPGSCERHRRRVFGAILAVALGLTAPTAVDIAELHAAICRDENLDAAWDGPCPGGQPSGTGIAEFQLAGGTIHAQAHAQGGRIQSPMTVLSPPELAHASGPLLYATPTRSLFLSYPSWLDAWTLGQHLRSNTLDLTKLLAKAQQQRKPIVMVFPVANSRPLEWADWSAPLVSKEDPRRAAFLRDLDARSVVVACPLMGMRNSLRFGGVGFSGNPVGFGGASKVSNCDLVLSKLRIEALRRSVYRGDGHPQFMALSPNGRLLGSYGPDDWRELRRQIRGPAAEAPPLAAIQRRLAELGYAPGPADGATGPRTRAAIEAYQRDAGLAIDGQPSAKLLQMLLE